MRSLAAACLTGWLVAAGCSGTSDVASGSNQSMETLNHPSGFTVRFDNRTLSATEIERGFRFQERDAASRRSPSTIEVTLESGAQPPGTWPESRAVEGREVRYRVDSREGGSGGDLFLLNAWVECSARHLIVRQETQAETRAEADFQPAWSILAGLSCPA